MGHAPREATRAGFLRDGLECLPRIRNIVAVTVGTRAGLALLIDRAALKDYIDHGDGSQWPSCRHRPQTDRS